VTPADHAATVQGGFDWETQVEPPHVVDARRSLAALVALAERATKLEATVAEWEASFADDPLIKRAVAAEARATELERANSEGRAEEAQLRAEYLAVKERAERAETALRTFRDSYDIWRNGCDEAHLDLAYDAARAALGETAPETITVTPDPSLRDYGP
jgi:cell division septum initiation protein DivIVA